jgi:hypothetical protein
MFFGLFCSGVGEGREAVRPTEIFFLPGTEEVPEFLFEERGGGQILLFL